VHQCGGDKPLEPEELKRVFNVEEGLKILLNKRPYLSAGCLSSYSIFSKEDPDRDFVKQKFEDSLNSPFIDVENDRAMGCFLGMVIGDALGAPFEFSGVDYTAKEMTQGFSEKEIWKKQGYNRFRLKPGQWTDDASMGLCIADSLICNKGLNHLDLRLRFQLWWTMGYCNAFGFDPNRSIKNSVGLGGNISLSLEEFQRNQTKYTNEGDGQTSGNGSIMRNAAIPVFCAKDIKKGEEMAWEQSKTTHQGLEAAECCRLLTHICIKAINGDGTKNFLDNLNFESNLYSINCLAKSECEKKHQENKDLKLEDRQWDWQCPTFRYSENRAQSQPGYVGSYAMDALAMALHCVWTTNNFRDALLKCANLRGDSDSVSAVAGQIAGAIYGKQGIPQDWIETILIWDPEFDIPLRAYKLFNKKDL